MARWNVARIRGRGRAGLLALPVVILTASGCLAAPAEGTVNTPQQPGQSDSASRLPQLLSQLQGTNGASLELLDGTQSQVLAAQEVGGKDSVTTTATAAASPSPSATGRAGSTATPRPEGATVTATPRPGNATPTPTSAPASTPTATPTPSSTATATPTATATATPTATPTATATIPTEGGGGGTPPHE